jgi:oxygen-independent coproporphyrinogen-3 oxidase
MRHMLADLEQLVAIGVDHIAHYELNVGGATDFALNRRDEIPPSETVREMYRAARDLLAANGYRQLTAYDFQKVQCGEEFVYEECKRGFARTESWGWGFAGVSDFGGTGEHGGWTYVNHRRVKTLAAPTVAVSGERASRAPEDPALHELFRSQGMRVDRMEYRQRRQRRLRRGLAPGLELVERGWCTVSPDAIKLHGDGVYYVPLIQALLSQARLADLRSSASSVAIAI